MAKSNGLHNNLMHLYAVTIAHDKSFLNLLHYTLGKVSSAVCEKFLQVDLSSVHGWQIIFSEVAFTCILD